jgi:hypothetical protein
MTEALAITGVLFALTVAKKLVGEEQRRRAAGGLSDEQIYQQWVEVVRAAANLGKVPTRLAWAYLGLAGAVPGFLAGGPAGAIAGGYAGAQAGWAIGSAIAGAIPSDALIQQTADWAARTDFLGGYKTSFIWEISEGKPPPPDLLRVSKQINAEAAASPTAGQTTEAAHQFGGMILQTIEGIAAWGGGE